MQNLTHQFREMTSLSVETSSTNEPVVEHKIALSNKIEASLKDDQLSIVGQDMANVPLELGQYAKGIVRLDLSWNCLKYVTTPSTTIINITIETTTTTTTVQNEIYFSILVVALLSRNLENWRTLTSLSS